MRPQKKPAFIFLMLFIFLYSCTGTKEVIKDDKDDDIIIQEKKEYNFKFIGYDINIDDPEKDRRSYYKIKINKIEVGRTTIGLESQEKFFESTLPSNRHLLMVEKWALNIKKGKYIKLNNIEQPKPSYKYFVLPEDNIVKITLENDPVSRESTYYEEIE